MYPARLTRVLPFLLVLSLALDGCAWGGEDQRVPTPAATITTALTVIATPAPPPRSPTAPATPAQLSGSRPRETASTTPHPARSAAATPAVWGEPFGVSAGQARAIATVIAFLDAYNAGQVDAALALLTDDVIGNDCDYRNETVVSFNGKSQAAAWLRDRAADHDQLIISEIANSNPDQRAGGSGAHVVGVSYARRTSDSLRSRGFPDGIVPRLATKVILVPSDDRLGAFANGPNSGPAEECRPVPTTPTRPASPATPPTRGAASPNARNDETLALSAQEAEQVAVVLGLLRAYTADLAAVLALVSDEIEWFDCLYDERGGLADGVRGKEALTAWLGQRFAEQDHLEIKQVAIRNGVVAVSYQRRTSEALRRVGFPEGIVPNTATKVVFDYFSGPPGRPGRDEPLPDRRLRQCLFRRGGHLRLPPDSSPLN